MDDLQRVLRLYKRRDRRFGKRFFIYEDLVHLYRIHERHRATLCLLASAGYQTLCGVRILDVGCGDGNMLRTFLEWGADPEHLAGIELRPQPVARARHLNPNVDVRCGSASELPWPDGLFDLVCQHTLFTVLDQAMRQRVAAEMRRVLRSGRAVLWYDLVYSDPWNRAVRGIGTKEIRALFPGFELHLQRLTPATPLVRRVPAQLLPVVYTLLSAVPLLRTHYLGLLIKP